MPRTLFENIQYEPEIRIWHDIWVVRVSDVGDDFSKWLYGQTLPYVLEDESPSDWAYYSDYSRWVRKLKVID